VRASLAHYAKHVLAPYYERVTTTLPHDAAKRRWMQATSHTLEEAMACFIHPPPAHHNEVPLNGGRQWDKGHIDPRYAHTQYKYAPCRYERSMLEPVNLLCMWSFCVWCGAVVWRMLELY
jgi:hypothetical protein